MQKQALLTNRNYCSTTTPLALKISRVFTFIIPRCASKKRLYIAFCISIKHESSFCFKAVHTFKNLKRIYANQLNTICQIQSYFYTCLHIQLLLSFLILLLQKKESKPARKNVSRLLFVFSNARLHR
jgi:hypothetical protein